jgi:hypothetical protein
MGELVVEVEDEYDDRFRDFPKLLTRSRDWRTEKNKHRGEVVKRRRGFVTGQEAPPLANDVSDQAMSCQIANASRYATTS